MEEAVYFKSEGSTLYVRATGHVTALVCPPLKDAIFARLDAPPPAEAVYLDLSGCEYMDSTFLGLIVGAQKRFSRASKEAGRKPIVLFGTNDACKGLLRTIGVLAMGMVEFSEERPPFPADLPRVSSEAKASARFLLDAHEELSALSDDNRQRFFTLTSILKKAADSEGGGPDEG